MRPYCDSGETHRWGTIGGQVSSDSDRNEGRVTYRIDKHFVAGRAGRGELRMKKHQQLKRARVGK